MRQPPQQQHRPRRCRRRMEAKYRRRRFAVGTAALGIVGTLVVGGLALGHLQSNLDSSPLRSDDSAEVLNDNTHGTNILILGSDTRDLDGDEYGDAGGARSDAMVLAHLSEDETRIGAIQIPRDTMMDLPACPDTGRGASAGGYGAVNSALNAGPACSVAAVESLSGVRLDHFIEMNFEGFTTMVDAMDGAPVCLPEALQGRRANLDLPAGEQTVDGRDALVLARTRHAVGDGSDIARMGHQQQVMSAIVQRARSSEVLTHPDRLYGFLDAVTSSLTVDEDLNSLSALTSLATEAANVEDSNISFRVMPWEEEPTDHNRVIPSAEAAEVFQRLHADQPLDGEGEAAADDQASSADQDTADGTTAGDSDAGASGAGESDSTTAQPDGQQGEDSSTVETAGDMCG